MKSGGSCMFVMPKGNDLGAIKQRAGLEKLDRCISEETALQ